MDFDGIFGISPQCLDNDALLYPFEENFNVPTVTVKIGDFQGADFEVVGYKTTSLSVSLS